MAQQQQRWQADPARANAQGRMDQEAWWAWTADWSSPGHFVSVAGSQRYAEADDSQWEHAHPGWVRGQVAPSAPPPSAASTAALDRDFEAVMRAVDSSSHQGIHGPRDGTDVYARHPPPLPRSEPTAHFGAGARAHHATYLLPQQSRPRQGQPRQRQQEDGGVETHWKLRAQAVDAPRHKDGSTRFARRQKAHEKPGEVFAAPRRQPPKLISRPPKHAPAETAAGEHREQIDTQFTRAAAAQEIVGLRQKIVLEAAGRKKALDLAVTTIAAAWRGYVARKRIERMMHTVTETLHAERAAARLAEEAAESERIRVGAAVLVQKWWRGRVERRKFRSERDLLRASRVAKEAVRQTRETWAMEKKLSEQIAPGSQIHVRGVGKHGWNGKAEGRGEYESEPKLRALFAFAGAVVGVHVRHRIDMETGENTSWALITFATKAMAEKALEKAEGLDGGDGIMAGTVQLQVTRFSSKQAARSTGGGMTQVRQDMSANLEFLTAVTTHRAAKSMKKKSSRKKRASMVDIYGVNS